MPLYQNEVRCSAFDMEMIFHSHANKIHFHNKGCALDLILKVRVFGTRKWPISFVNFEAHLSVSIENVLTNNGNDDYILLHLDNYYNLLLKDKTTSA